MLSDKKNNPSRHLYSVLERDNDPLRQPEPTDNDTVFVEANPLYSSTKRYQVNKSNAGNVGGYAEANPLYGTTTGFNVSQWWLGFFFVRKSVLYSLAMLLTRGTTYRKGCYFTAWVALSDVNCSSYKSSKDHLLLIQCYYRRKPKLN